VLACAGLDRLGLSERIDERIDPALVLPAVGQGALALEARAGTPLATELAAVSHAPTARAVWAERAFSARLEGDCQVPLAALAEPRSDGSLRLRALLASRVGDRIARAEVDATDPDAAGADAVRIVLGAGGGEILEDLRRESAT
jgi:hydroxymethylbilane synthase